MPVLKEADDMHNGSSGIGPIAELLAKVDLIAEACWLHSTWSSIKLHKPCTAEKCQTTSIQKHSSDCMTRNYNVGDPEIKLLKGLRPPPSSQSPALTFCCLLYCLGGLCTDCHRDAYCQVKRGDYFVTHDSTPQKVMVKCKLPPHTGGYASGGFSDRGSDPGQGFPEDSMAELDQWADLAAAGDRAFPGGGPPADADSMSYEELCQAHIEAFIQVCLCGTKVFMRASQVWHVGT